MYVKKNYFALVFMMLLLLAGCGEGNVTRELERSEIISVQITPALMHWQTKLHRCALGLVDATIVLEILPPDDLDPNKADVSLRFGPKRADETHVSVLADEHLIIIAHPENPLQEISLQSLKMIFSGEVQDWQALPEMKNSEYKAVIQPVQFENDHELSQVLAAALGMPEGLQSKGIKAISLADMVQQVQADPNAIGYVLESQAQGAIKKIDIADETELFIALEQPVIAISQIPPEGSLLQLLLCLQSSDSPKP